MKKVSRSILPEQHKQTNNIQRVYDAIKDRNGLDANKKQILDAVNRILQKYRECEEETQDKRDRNLVHFIMDSFQELLKPYIDNFSKTVELDQIIEEAVQGDEIQEKLHKEILKVLKASIKKLQVKSQKNGKTSVSKTIDKNLESIFNDLQKSKNPNLQKYRKSVSELNKKHTSEIITAYRKSCKSFYDKIVQSKQQNQPIRRTQKVGSGDLKKIHEKQVNILKKKFKPFQVVEKRKNYFSFLNEIFRRMKGWISKVFGPVFRVIRKIGGVIFGTIGFVLKWTILPLAKGVLGLGKLAFKGIKLIGKGFIKTIQFFKLDKMIKGVFTMFVDIGKLVGKALKNTFLAFIMTPAGMYAMGFILGFLWKKISKGFKGGSILNQIEQIKNLVIQFTSPFFKGIRELFFGILNDYIKPVVDFFSPIVKATGDVANKMLTWILGNNEEIGTFVSVILTLCPVLETLLSIAGPAKAALKAAGHPLAALIAAGTLSIYFGIKNMWAFRKDEDFHLAKGKSKLFSKFEGPSAVQIKGLNVKDQKNYDDLSNKIGAERNDLEQLINDIEEIKSEYEDDQTITLDMSKTFPDFVESVFNSELFGNDKAELKKFKNFSKNKRVVDQMRELVKFVNKRYDKLITIQAGLSSTKSTSELQNMLSRIASFDNGKITISENVDNVAKSIKKDDYNGNEKTWWKPTTWGNDPEKAQKLALHNADKLAGKKFKYKVTTTNISGTQTREVSEDEYLRNISNLSGAYGTGMSTTAYRYEKIEEGLPQAKSSDIDSLLQGLDEKEKQIVKNYLLSSKNPNDIEQLKKSNTEGRNKIFSDILKNWYDQLVKNEEEKRKAYNTKVDDEIKVLDEETLRYEQLNKDLQKKLEEMTKEK